ncbi:hypothetical protein PLANTIT3_90012 [Plantibacter sp. T3]|nr:hypothetical protein PLANTIT3_90012 [Plantibacter sp. T3]
MAPDTRVVGGDSGHRLRRLAGDREHPDPPPARCDDRPRDRPGARPRAGLLERPPQSHTRMKVMLALLGRIRRDPFER